MKQQPPELFFKKAVLKNFEIFLRKHLCWSLFLIKLSDPKTAILLKKTPTQFFSCKYCKMFENTYFEEHLRTTAFGICQFRFALSLYYNLGVFFEMISKYRVETTTYYTIKFSGKLLSVGGFGLRRECPYPELF